MSKYVCSICGYVFEETESSKWEDLPENWECPLCGAPKSAFNKVGEESKKPTINDEEITSNTEGLSNGALKALCLNLSRGCEKQYRLEEAELFKKLADYYALRVKESSLSEFTDLTAALNDDLANTIVKAKALASELADRGSLRALTWDEKVSTILKSILTRYQSQNDALLSDNKVYVCEICGFIYIGNELMDICPICKVPNSKIHEVKRG